MYIETYVVGYAAWQPVRINAGDGGTSAYGTGFFINSTGFQWTSHAGKNGTESDEFGGWLVCDWWHGGKRLGNVAMLSSMLADSLVRRLVPQLFFRNKYYNTTTPRSCADVNLIPDYI